MCPKRHGNGPIGTPNPPRHQRGHQEITATATVLFRDSNTCIALFGQKLPHPARKIVGALDFSIMRSNRVSCKSKGTLISKLMLFREFKVHGFWSFLVWQVKHRPNWLNKVFYLIRHPLQVPNGNMYGRYSCVKGSVLFIRSRLQGSEKGGK